MTDEARLKILERAGLAVDDGGTIGTPFIPDGTVRIYELETGNLVSSGDTLADAFADVRELPGE